MGHCPPHWFGKCFQRLIGTFCPNQKIRGFQPRTAPTFGAPCGESKSNRYECNCLKECKDVLRQRPPLLRYLSDFGFLVPAVCGSLNFGGSFRLQVFANKVQFTVEHTQLEIDRSSSPKPPNFKTPAFSQNNVFHHFPSPSITGAKGPWKQSTLCGIDTWDTKKTTPTFH